MFSYISEAVCVIVDKTLNTMKQVGCLRKQGFSGRGWGQGCTAKVRVRIGDVI